MSKERRVVYIEPVKCSFEMEITTTPPVLSVAAPLSMGGSRLGLLPGSVLRKGTLSNGVETAG